MNYIPFDSPTGNTVADISPQDWRDYEESQKQDFELECTSCGETFYDSDPDTPICPACVKYESDEVKNQNHDTARKDI